MVWTVSAELDLSELEDRLVYESLGEAVLGALDLADKAGRAMPETIGRKVHVVGEDGAVELSVSIIPGGLLGMSV